MIRREKKRIIVKTHPDLESEGIPNLHCPKCGTEMETGFTLAARGLIFRRKSEKLKMAAAHQLLPNTANVGIGTRENLAWKCPRCNLVTVDFNFQVKKQK